jgi:hypothetical protein
MIAGHSWVFMCVTDNPSLTWVHWSCERCRGWTRTSTLQSPDPAILARPLGAPDSVPLLSCEDRTVLEVHDL